MNLDTISVCLSSGPHPGELQPPGPNWNLYDIRRENPENLLFDSTITEYNEISGFPVEYYIALEDRDRLYGEDPNSAFLPPRLTKITYLPTSELNIIDEFGFSSDEAIQYCFIPKTTFSLEVSGNGYIPKPGDVIKTLWNNRKYEIVDIGSEEKIFNAVKFVWEFILRPFRFAQESTSHSEVEFGTSSVDPSGAIFGELDLLGIDNKVVEDKSNQIDNYSDVDSKIYGF